MATRKRRQKHLLMNGRQLKLPKTMSAAEKKDLEKRYRWHRDFGSAGRVGYSAEDSYKLARAEQLAEKLGWEFEWEDEQEDWDEFLGDVPREEVSSIEFVQVKDEDGEQLASVGGVMFGHDSRLNRGWRRMFEAELAVEAADRLGLL